MARKPAAPKKPRTTLITDAHIKGLLEAIRAGGTTAEDATDHAVLRAALRMGLALFVSSPEARQLALKREYHRLPLEAADLKPSALKSINKALDFQRAS